MTDPSESPRIMLLFVVSESSKSLSRCEATVGLGVAAGHDARSKTAKRPMNDSVSTRNVARSIAK